MTVAICKFLETELRYVVFSDPKPFFLHFQSALINSFVVVLEQAEMEINLEMKFQRYFPSTLSNT
ncbi:hypothetical protein T01_1982 [Trichinella spiralis]|uniref:Uncharacterized protein n=1 Tax=Trichinella spiralis TaxID=6334 RepID=A0A0V1ATH1_TRISP|nr:hypothetical protein T01_1982 [Trichinella spiralis]